MAKQGGSSRAFVFFMLVILAGAAFLTRGFWKEPLQGLLSPATAGTSRPADGTGMTISLREDKAKELLAPYLENALQASLQSLAFEDNRIKIGATIHVSRLINEKVAKAMPELAMVKAVLPAETTVSMEFTPEIKEDALAITPNACRVGGYAIPVGLIPSEVIASLNGMITDQIAAYGIEITSVLAANGVLTVTVS